MVIIFPFYFSPDPIVLFAQPIPGDYTDGSDGLDYAEPRLVHGAQKHGQTYKRFSHDMVKTEYLAYGANMEMIFDEPDYFTRGPRDDSVFG